MVLIAYIFFAVLQIVLAAFIVFLCLAFITGGPFVPTSQKSVDAMIASLHIKPGMTVYDMGSGDGRVLFAAAARGAQAIGVEINPILVWYTRLRAFFSPYRSNITVICGDLWRTDLSNADLVFIYLIPWRMDEFAAKLTRELKPGSLVVSNSFLFPNWKVIHADARHHMFTFRIS